MGVGSLLDAILQASSLRCPNYETGQLLYAILRRVHLYVASNGRALVLVLVLDFILFNVADRRAPPFQMRTS